MNDLQIFNNPQFGDIRAVEIDGEAWLVGKDVAKALGYKDTVNALKAHVDEEDKGGWRIATPSGEQEMTIINQSGIYSLIFSSKLPDAKKFKRWVTSEVLPAIMKTGAYLTPAAEARMSALEKRMNDLTAVNDLLLDLDTRLTQLERRVDPSPGLMSITDIRPLAPGSLDRERFAPGLAARKRWMRTASEKLDLMSARFNTTHNEILHSLYQHLEKRCGVAMEEEKLKVMEEYNLVDCSVLTAIFYNAELRDAFEENIDYNLAPENRGW